MWNYRVRLELVISLTAAVAWAHAVHDPVLGCGDSTILADRVDKQHWASAS